MLFCTIPLSCGLLSWKEFISLFQAMEGPALQTMVEKFANASLQRIPLLEVLVHLSGLVTTKAIIKGSALLVNYGPGYQRKNPYVRDPQDDPNAHGSVWDETTMHLAQVICASCFAVQLGYELLGGDCPSLRTQEPSVHGQLAGRQPFAPTPPSLPPLPGNWRESAGQWAPSASEANFS